MDSSSVRSFGVSVDGKPCVWPCSFSGIKQCLYIQVNVGLPPSNQADNRLKKRIPSRNRPSGDAPCWTQACAPAPVRRVKSVAV
ncbi:hypothetical protein CBM2609_A140124 [Cupriavidus taiwanensis]|nr:hypothetical protein CBM2604_A120123 [Cupriavidus taiwanensis]SOZ25399.1 hypothetical protein CBM2609_A140124 [Cupriavidus taiwanensis]SOZ44650.1 hypothetical protein CBM2610_A150124 [Cupriavidus taiwanensis]